MDVIQDWQLVRRIFYDGMRTGGYCAVASTNPDNTAHVTPIGSLILYEPGHGVYADEFPVQLSRNIARNPRVSVMSVNFSKGFWFKSLLMGKFSKPPAIRLYGTAGNRRPGTDREINNWLKRVRMFRRLKGYALLWRDMRHFRDIYFDRAKVVATGEMSREAEVK